MVTVDSKGRIVLPQEVRDRLGITPGTEVEVREERGKAVVEPEDNPEEVLERMEQLIEEASAKRDTTRPSNSERHPIAQSHAETIRNGTQRSNSDDE